MAALNFPASPTVGQQYSANGVTYEWDGVTWLSQPPVSAPWSVSAVGTGASQDVSLPDEYTVDQVLVFVNGIRYETDEYTILATDLTLTTNAVGDSIQIVGVLS